MFELTPFAHRTRYGTVVDPFRAFDDIEKSFFGRSMPAFKTDIRETSEGYIIEAELPGFSREDIKAEIKGGYLTISAERRFNSESDEASGYVRRERSYGSFSRTFDLDGIKTDAITASYKDGILSLTLPREEMKVEEGKRLEIK